MEMEYGESGDVTRDLTALVVNGLTSCPEGKVLVGVSPSVTVLIATKSRH